MRHHSRVIALAVAASINSGASIATADDPAPSETPPQPPTDLPQQPKERPPMYALDLNFEGGMGWLAEPDKITGFGRGRVGLLVALERLRTPMRSPLFVAVGATYELSDRSLATVGLQTEIIHQSTGFWFQAGPLVDLTRPEPGLMASVGWSLLGVEVQRRLFDDLRTPEGKLTSTGIYGKIRVPISIIMRAF